MRAKLKLSSGVKCSLDYGNSVIKKKTAAHARNEARKEAEADFCLNCPHPYQGCKGSCKEYREWRDKKHDRKMDD